MTIRVLHIVPSLGWCDANAQLFSLMTRLDPESVSSRICLLQRPVGHAWPNNCPVCTVNRRRTFDLEAMRRLHQQLRWFDPDVVHVWRAERNLFGLVAATWDGGSPVVATWTAPRLASWHDRSLWRHTVRHLARSTVTDREICPQFPGPHKSGDTNDDPEVIGLPDPQEPESGEDSLEGSLAILRSLGIPSGAALIVATGDLSHAARWKDAIFAADLLKVARDDTHLLILGDGPQKWRLERFRKQSEIGDRVHFLSVSERPARMPGILRAADIYWSTAVATESIVSMQFAMSRGIPVVASDVRCHRRVIQHGENGLLFPLGNRALLARNTHQLLEDTQLRTKLISAARKDIQKRHSTEEMVQRFSSLYHELAVKSPSELPSHNLQRNN